MAKSTVNVSINKELVTQARKIGVNFSATLEERLTEIVGAERKRRLKEENRAATEGINAYIEKHGLPLAKHRLF